MFNFSLFTPFTPLWEICAPLLSTYRKIRETPEVPKSTIYDIVVKMSKVLY